MKKIAAIAMAFLFIASSALFAQVKVNGGIRYNAKLGIEKDVDDPTFDQDVWNSGTFITASYTGESVSAFVKINGTGDFDSANVVWTPGPVSLTAAYGWTPIANWSPLALYGDNNYQFGATSISKTAQFKVAVSGFYLGIYQPKKQTDNVEKLMKWDGTGVPEGIKVDEDGKPTNVSDYVGQVYGWVPGFYAGYDMTVSEGIDIGIALQAVFEINSDVKDALELLTKESAKGYGFAGAVHAKLNFGAPTVFANVGLVVDPDQEYGVPRIGYGIDTMYLEGYVGLAYPFTESLGIEATVGLLAGLDKNTDPHFRIGADVPITTASGVQVRPGLIFDYNTAGDDTYTVTPGVTVTYSF